MYSDIDHEDSTDHSAFIGFFGMMIGAIIMAVIAWKLLGGEGELHRKKMVRAGVAHYSATSGEYIEDSTVVRGDTVFVTRMK